MIRRLANTLRDRRLFPNAFIDKLEQDPGIVLAVKPEVILFAESKKNGLFNRYDLAVRLLAIEEYYKKNSFGFGLYQKMQERRVASNSKVPKDRANNLERFINLITSFERHGFINHFPIIINKHFELIDGSHRLALALYYQMGIIPALTNKMHFSERVDYGLNWFKNNGFSTTEIELIQERQLLMMDNFKKEFVAIIWPAAYRWHEQIVQKLANENQVYYCGDLKFHDEKCFSDFVRRVYDLDDIASWKVDKKITIAKQFDLRCFVIKFFVTSPKYKRILISDKYKGISMKVKDIKERIRRDVRSKIDNYFYDVIIHISDNEYETNQINQLIKNVNGVISRNTDLKGISADVNIVQSTQGKYYF